jgi:hypothetical protein
VARCIFENGAGITPGNRKIPLQPLYAKLRYIMKNCSGVAAISEQYINWSKPFGINGKRPLIFIRPFSWMK